MIRPLALVRSALVAVVVCGLAVDAWVHLDLAAAYDGVRSSVLDQGQLFRAEAAAALLSAVLLLARPRRWTAVVALLVAGAGVAAVVLYRYVDVGALGPLPDMYEPVWFPRKLQSAWAEGVATLAAAALLAVPTAAAPHHRKDDHARQEVRDPRRSDRRAVARHRRAGDGVRE